MTEPLPTFSIVVPTYDRPKQLAACLAAFERLDYPVDRFEVIVVDDGSPESPEGTVEPFREGLQLEWIRQRNRGPAVARNSGAARARGEFLAFTDDDCTPAPDWLRALAARFASDPESAIGGHVINPLTENVFSAASQILLEYLYGYFESRQGRFFASNNMAVSTAGFLTAGGFHEEMPLAAGEDREFCIRWDSLGRGMLYAPEAVVLHAHQLDFARFWRQHFTYGRGAYKFREMLRRDGHGNVDLEPLTFYANMMLYPFREMRTSRALSMSFLMAVAQVANAAGFFRERAAPPSRHRQPG